MGGGHAVGPPPLENLAREREWREREMAKGRVGSAFTALLWEHGWCPSRWPATMDKTLPIVVRCTVVPTGCFEILEKHSVRFATKTH